LPGQSVRDRERYREEKKGSKSDAHRTCPFEWRIIADIGRVLAGNFGQAGCPAGKPEATAQVRQRRWGRRPLDRQLPYEAGVPVSDTCATIDLKPPLDEVGPGSIPPSAGTCEGFPVGAQAKA